MKRKKILVTEKSECSYLLFSVWNIVKPVKIKSKKRSDCELNGEYVDEKATEILNK